MIQEAKGGSQGMRITFCELSDEEVAALAKAGNEEAYNHINRIKRYLQGYAYEENVDNLKNIIKQNFKDSELKDKVLAKIERNKDKFKERDLQEVLELEYNKNKKMSRNKTLQAINDFLESKYKK